MSQENVEAFERGTEAFNNADAEALVEVADPGVEFHDVFGRMLGGEERIYHGHQGLRDLVDDLRGAFAETHSKYSEIRDLGDRTIGIGRLRAVGKESGAEIESPICTIAEWKNGKATSVRTWLDPEEARKAAGLRE
jgi:ketosteroid isomerase-like protein